MSSPSRKPRTVHRSSPGLTPSDDITRLISAFEEFEARSAELRRTLQRREVLVRATVRRLRICADVDQIIRPGTPDTAESRQLTSDIDALERARLNLRVELVEVGRRRGLSIGEIARRWGLSRQLVSRYAKGA